jgi:NTP pyrophosphatase (non-canonical NTP hydrolase)
VSTVDRWLERVERALLALEEIADSVARREKSIREVEEMRVYLASHQRPPEGEEAMIIPPGTAMGTPVVQPKLELTFNEYDQTARKTAIYPQIHAVFDRRDESLSGDPMYYTNMEPLTVIYPALKLAGEAGEFAEKLGKVLRDDAGRISPERKEALLKELGDVLWYVAAAARELGSSLPEVARLNLEKLTSRADRGVLGGSGDER